MDEDLNFMKRAIELARRGAGLVSPNPMVGAVLVSDGRVVGEGYHRYDRLKHAETYAIEMAGERAKGATLYCSLEPCCHYGRTSPCTDAVIEAGIARAVIAMEDPDLRVSGKGIEQLREAGIKVEIGLCENEARQLNEAYIKHITTVMPFVHGVIDSTDKLDWQPSPKFIEQAGMYDAIALGENHQANLVITQAFLSRERHRLPIIICTPDDLNHIDGLKKSANHFVGVILIKADDGLVASVHSDENSPAAQSTEAGIVSLIAPGFDSIVAALSRLRATSLLMLPRSRVCDEQSILENSDRLTAILSGDEIRGLFEAPELSLSERITLEVTGALQSGDALEVTGYPKRTERIRI